MVTPMGDDLFGRALKRAALCLGLAPFLLSAGSIRAQDSTSVIYEEKAVELGLSYSWFTEGLGRGDYEYVHFYRDREVYDLVSIEVGRASRFGDVGVGGAAMYTRYFKRGPIAGIGFSTGSGDFVYPEYRFDLRLGWSFLSERNMRLYLRYVRSQSKIENYFDGFGVELEYYVDEHWVVETVGRYDVGYPGRRISTWGGLWVGYVIWKEAVFQVGGRTGDVSYQLVGPEEALVDYNSTSVDGFAQLYLWGLSGLESKVEYEANDIYNVFTITLGFFKEW